MPWVCLFFCLYRFKFDKIMKMLIQSVIFIFILFLTGRSMAQQLPDTLGENKKPIKAYIFMSNLSIRNAVLQTRYACNKTPDKSADSLPFKRGWTLTFYDDFDTLDTKKWRRGQAWGEFHSEHPHQYYSNEQIRTKSGFLYLGGAYSPRKFKSGDSIITIPYAVGLINSDISFSQKYGYFEIRSMNPAGAAAWPAFWLTGAHRWPPEIDIFEMYGKKGKGSIHNQCATIHYGKAGKRSRGYLSKRINLPNNTDSVFHIYGCEWTPTHIKFFTDGKLVRYIRVNKRLRKWMNDEMVVIINNSFDENYLKYLPKDFKGNQFVVDWVRVYRKK